MLENVVYFSGTHGMGKTTLIKDIAEDDSFIRYKKHIKNKLEHTYHRMVVRVSRYWVEAHEMHALAHDTGKIVLGDRCIHDNSFYGMGFRNLNWIPEHDFTHHENAVAALFRKDELPKNIVHMTPPLDWIQERLNERWKIREKKWHEDDFTYLKAVYDASIEFYNNLKGANVLRLEETDKEKRVECVKTWMRKTGILKNPILNTNNS